MKKRILELDPKGTILEECYHGKWRDAERLPNGPDERPRFALRCKRFRVLVENRESASRGTVTVSARVIL